MHTVSTFKAESRSTAIPDEVEEGCEVLIRRRGRPVVRPVSADAGFSRAKARRAADGLRVASKGLTLGGCRLGS